MLLQQQVWSFTVAFLTGVATGVILDVYRVIRSLAGLRKVGTAIGDVFTWIAAACAAFALLLTGNWAEIRLYITLALVGGLTFYVQILSRIFCRGFRASLITGNNLLHSLIRAIVFPFKLIIKLLFVPFSWTKYLLHLLWRIFEYGAGFPGNIVYTFYRRFMSKPPPPL